MPEFPGWDGRNEFVEAWRAAVRTRSRLTKRVPKHPPTVLRTGPETSLQALKALEEGLQRSSTMGRLVPCTSYAYVEGRDGTRTRLIEQIAEQLRKNTPPEMGKLRLPVYDLVHSITDEQGAPSLEQVYARLRNRRAVTSEANGGVTFNAGPLTVPLESVLRAAAPLRRKCWEWRWRLHLGFGRRYRPLWPDDYRGEQTLESALTRFDEVRRAGAEAWDGLLLTALMIDLYGQARQGLLHPGRRRRRARHALLVDGSGSGADVVSSFISLYDETLRVCPNPATVTVAALPRDPGTQPGPPTLAEAGRKLAGARREALASVHVTPGEPSGHTKVVRPVWKPWLRVRPRPELFLEGVALVVAAWLAGGLSFLPLPTPPGGENTDCLVASHKIRQGRQGHDSAQAQYKDALSKINEWSKEAEQQGDPDRTVTIALIHSTPPKNENELRAGGAVPDLRGVALALKSLNESAPRNDNGVWVRIKPYDAGVQYENAEQQAKEVIEDAKKDPKLVGVTGFTESRTATVAALERLNEAEIPVVTSTATAKAMEVGRQYHGVAPNNAREAKVVASFLKEANTVRTDENSCAPPDHVAVVTDPADVYSNELGQKFVEQKTAPPTGPRIGYSPGNYSPDVSSESELDRKYSMEDVASAVCERVKKEPRTLVYWTSRVREFETFLDGYQNSQCANEKLTVMGGNELTNAALSGGYADKHWLRLYHTAHTLPANHPNRGAEAREFNSMYGEEFGKKDLWLNDGHAPLAHDAVRVFAWAARKALTADLTRLDIRNVHQYIVNGSFSMEGATGSIRFTNGAPRPADKMLTVLHHEEGESGAVLVCGKPGNNIQAGKQWQGGNRTYDCPED